MDDALSEVSYLHLSPGQQPPSFDGGRPFKAVLILEQASPAEWQEAISTWLVENGCLFMMAWGLDCSSWDDSVDWASISRFFPDEIPDEHHVMTTWHDDEPLSDVFLFSEQCAWHETASLGHTLLLHISSAPRGPEILKGFSEARAVA